MRIGYLGAAAVSLGITLAGASFAATVNKQQGEGRVAIEWANAEQPATLIFGLNPDILDEPAPNCAADGLECPQFVPSPGGNGDYVVIPLPPAIFGLAAGIAALFGLGWRRRSA